MSPQPSILHSCPTLTLTLALTLALTLTLMSFQPSTFYSSWALYWEDDMTHTPHQECLTLTLTLIHLIKNAHHRCLPCSQLLLQALYLHAMIHSRHMPCTGPASAMQALHAPYDRGVTCCCVGRACSSLCSSCFCQVK